MKFLLLVVSLCISGIVNAATYYFSSSTGDDSRSNIEAQNPATPWKTLGKLNLIFTSLVAGDNILFQRGDVFYGSIAINKSGSSASPITLGAFGSGAKPVISGFTSVDTWTNLGGNIWESSSAVSSLSTCNTLSINGASYAMGRTPDAGYWNISSTNGSTTITDATNLNAATTNWTGGQVVVRELMYEVNKHDISSASGSTITFAGGSIPANWGYFIQNHVLACNLQNEWAFNSSTKKVSIYSTTSPVNVKAPSIEEGVNLGSKDYITFDNLDFQGYNTTGMNTTSRTGIKIQNCDFSFIGVNAIYGYPNSANLRVTGSNFTDIGSRAIHCGSSSNAYISGNTLLRVGHYAGMGSNGDDSYTGIISNGDNAEVSYNSITNVGYCGIRWDGNGTVIKNNLVKNTTYIKDDGGAIYCYPNNLGNVVQTFVTRTVRDNIVINALSAPAGSPYGNQGCGIYMDGQSPNIRVIHNSISNDNTVSTGFLGIFVNGGHDIFCDSNTTYNWASGYYLTKIGGPIDNTTLTNNVLVARTTNASCGLGQYAANYRPSASGMPASFVASNNVYARPLDQAHNWIFSVMPSNSCSSVAQWQSLTGKDAGSTASPRTITNVNDLRFVYNETDISKTINLGANYVDIKNIAYPGTITLAPYSSAVLIKNDATNIPPVSDAGTDQTIPTPITVTLIGNGIDYDGTITAYAWTKISGPAAGSITGATSTTASVAGLTTGVYKFELKVTDNNGATGKDTVTVNFGNVVVPVTLVDFTATAKSNRTTLLQWKTATEINSDYFIVERSTDGRNFIEIGTVDANGNSNTTISYEKTDNFPETGINYYRLKIVDIGGQYQYSITVSVTFKNTKDGSLNIISTGSYTNRFDVNMNSTLNQPAAIAIYDAAGKVVYKSNIVLQKGQNIVSKYMLLPEAIYYFMIVTTNEKISLPMANRN